MSSSSRGGDRPARTDLATPPAPAPVRSESGRTIEALGRVFPAIVLVLLAPITAEYLLGNLTVRSVDWLPYVAPIYGFGALLIREVARQIGRGWPTIVALGFIFGVIEEGIALQSLFNPDFGNMHLLDYGFIPALGMASVYTITVLSLHIIWSVCAPIGLVELIFIRRRTKPWLGRTGLTIAALGYAAGVALFLRRTLQTFSAEPFQYGLAVAMLVVGFTIALFVSGARRSRPLPGAAPNPLVLGGLAFSGTSAMWVLQYFADTPLHLPAAATSALQLALAFGGLYFIFSAARREGWSNTHRFALVAGALCTYFWHGLYWVLKVKPVVVSVQLGLIAFHVALLVYAWRQLSAATDAKPA